MKAFLLKNNLGDVTKGWIVKGWQPDLSYYDQQLIQEFGFSLVEVTVEEALSDSTVKPGGSKQENQTHH